MARRRRRRSLAGRRGRELGSSSPPRVGSRSRPHSPQGTACQLLHRQQTATSSASARSASRASVLAPRSSSALRLASSHLAERSSPPSPRPQLTPHPLVPLLQVSATDFPGHHPGESHHWDLALFRRNLRVQLNWLSPTALEFDLVGVDASVANAIRRIVIAEVRSLSPPPPPPPPTAASRNEPRSRSSAPLPGPDSRHRERLHLEQHVHRPGRGSRPAPRPHPARHRPAQGRRQEGCVRPSAMLGPIAFLHPECVSLTPFPRSRR